MYLEAALIPTMGIGDDIIATSFAKGAAERGELVAFGDGRRIIWGPHSEMVFKNNPNIARPGQERGKNIQWVQYYKGHRIYNSLGPNRWIWNYKFKVKPGELFFDKSEIIDPGTYGNRLILIEPNLPKKRHVVNKTWPAERWYGVYQALVKDGWFVRQFDYGGAVDVTTIKIPTANFRQAAGYVKAARLIILPEGGLHHTAAAVGTPAIVLFGGFAPPAVLGYDGHTNLTGGVTHACGSFGTCQHCVEAMKAITVDSVVGAAKRILNYHA